MSYNSSILQKILKMGQNKGLMNNVQLIVDLFTN